MGKYAIGNEFVTCKRILHIKRNHMNVCYNKSMNDGTQRWTRYMKELYGLNFLFKIFILRWVDFVKDNWVGGIRTPNGLVYPYEWLTSVCISLGSI